MAISKARNIHYNTVRHILHRFYEDGHLKIKKSINDIKKNTTDSDPGAAGDNTQPDSNCSEQDVQILKKKRRYRKKIVKVKATYDKMLNSDNVEDEPKRDFILPGP